jgi:hypothetical protein
MSAPAPELLTLTATLKSGATVATEVEEASYSKGQIRWTTPDSWISKVLYLDLDEVAAVIITRKDPNGPA